MQASKLELALELARAGDQQAIAECLGWSICQGLGWEVPENLLAVDAYLVDGCFVLNFGSPRPLPKELLVAIVRRELPQFPLAGITRIRVCAWRTQAQAGEKIPVWSSDFRIEPQYRRSAKPTASPPPKLEPPRRVRSPLVPRRTKSRRWPIPWVLWASIPLFGLLGALLRLGLQLAERPAPLAQPANPTAVPAPVPSGEPVPTPATGALTLANFERVQEGMELAAVQALLGAQGQAIAETEVAGSKAQVFSWKNPDGSNAIVEFRDGKVTAKAQAGLL